MDDGELLTGAQKPAGTKLGQAMVKAIKSAGSALGADEIDSECRTNEDDSEHLSATAH